MIIYTYIHTFTHSFILSFTAGYIFPRKKKIAFSGSPWDTQLLEKQNLNSFFYPRLDVPTANGT